MFMIMIVCVSGILRRGVEHRKIPKRDEHKHKQRQMHFRKLITYEIVPTKTLDRNQTNGVS